VNDYVLTNENEERRGFLPPQNKLSGRTARNLIFFFPKNIKSLPNSFAFIHSSLCNYKVLEFLRRDILLDTWWLFRTNLIHVASFYRSMS
jgi:hypothetical protein